MAAGKRQQLGNKRVEPGSVLWQQNRTTLKQVDLGNEAGLLVAIGLYIDDINVLFPQRLDQACALLRALQRGQICSHRGIPSLAQSGAPVGTKAIPVKRPVFAS